MEANFRTSVNNNATNWLGADNADKARGLIAQHRNSTGSVNIGDLINAIKTNKDETDRQNVFIGQVDTELEKIAHPFDVAHFREEFKSELKIKDTLTYQGKPIAVGSAIDTTQQLRQYADDALFNYRNSKGVIEVTNEFAFIEPPMAQPSTIEISTAGGSAGDPACNPPPETLITFELDAALGKGGKKNISTPTAKLSIHDDTTKNEAKFNIGDKIKFGDVDAQLIGYAENTVDEGSIHANEKGALVTTVGIFGNAGIGIAPIENDAKTTSGSINALDTEFEVKTALHVDAKANGAIGTKSTAELKVNLVELNGTIKHTVNLPKKDVTIKMSGEAQAGLAIKAEMMTGILVENKTINVEGSLFRGKMKLEIEAKNKNCD